jgi:translocation protein SEC63
MSSFSDTFTRDENKDTQYDDSAFHTFAGTILLCIIIPLIYFIYKRIFFSKELMNTRNYKNCECKSCKDRLNRHYGKIKTKNINFTFYLMIFLVIFCSYLFYLSYFQIVSNGNNFKRFDPYEILEIQPTAETPEIKKAYRKLSLKYHPDKNPNNIQAKARFILIAKAYEALTDEAARKNYELYGNPDGPGSMRLAVGLPSFVLNKKNHMPILFIFLIFIIVIIPVFVWFWFSNSNKYDENGMIQDDSKVFYELLNENILLRQMPFVLGAAFEFSRLKIKQEEVNELEKLWRSYKETMPKHKEESLMPHNKKAICLLYAYLNNQTFTSPGFKEDLEFILKTAPMLLNNMYNMSIYLTQMHMMYPKNCKNFGYNCIKTIIEFSQLIHHKLSYVNSSPFLQLPYFDENKVKAIKKTNNNTNNEAAKLNNLREFLKFTPEARKFLLKNEFKSEEIEEVEICVKSMPVYDLKVEVFVEGFDEILVEDYLTIKITVERSNLEEQKVININVILIGTRCSSFKYIS